MFAVMMVSGSCSGIVRKLDRGTSDAGKMHSVSPLHQFARATKSKIKTAMPDTWKDAEGEWLN